MNRTLKELYGFYTAVYRCDRSREVAQNYRWIFEKHILSYIGDREIASLTPTEIQVVLNRMKGMSQTPINSVYNDMVLILRHAYLDGYTDKDYASHLTKPRHKKEEARRALTPKEREAVIAVAQTQRKYYAFLFMILCGARPSEAYNIRKEDINFVDETVHIRGTKTARSDRVVPCPRIILTIAEKSLSGLLTVSQKGLKVTKEMQRRIWHSFYIDCHKYLGGSMYRNAPCAPYPFGQDLTAYNLRHEYCTNLARHGVDIRITQRLMGHSSLDMTMRIYTNLSDEDVNTDELKKVVNNLHSFPGDSEMVI